MSLSLNSLADVPFFLGHKGDNASKVILLRRWEYENGASSFHLQYGEIPDILILHDDNNKALLEQTIDSAMLQTYSFENIVTYSISSRLACIQNAEKRKNTEDSTSTDLLAALGGNSAKWTAIIHAGDICNPSMAYSLIANSQHGDRVVYWNTITANVKIGQITPVSFLNAPLVDLLSEDITTCSSFAVRGSIKNKVIRNILEGNHPAITLYASRKRKINEFLLIKNVENNPISPLLMIDNTVRLEMLERVYGVGFDMVSTRGLSIPLPNTRIAKMSAIVMFKDKPRETRDCIKSIISNSSDISIEIVLVDNGSSKAAKDQVNQMISDFSDFAKFKLVSYDNVFNHSAQLLLALKHTSCELVAFINNDVIIQDPDVLMHSAKWALCLNVASAGVLHRDEHGENRGGPFKRRENVINIVNSLVEEYAEIPARPFKSFGNTFAFAVIKKSIFQAISVDPFRFPNGYNDVDYCLRSYKSGYDHITLGYLTLIHLKGATRGKTDESCQKALLRSDFGSFYLEPSELTEKSNASRKPITF